MTDNNLKVWAYATIWNEEKMLDFYLKHYSQFCEKIVFFDNESDDKSHAIINSYPNTEIRSYSTGGTFDDHAHLALKHMAVEESIGNCDYVIIGDCDEFIVHEDLTGFLQEHLGKTAVFFPAGFQMASTEFPSTEGQIYDHIKTGEPSPWYSKPIMLNPNMIHELAWVEGCHEFEYNNHVGEIYHVVPENLRPNGEYKGHSWGNWKIMFELLDTFEKEPLKLLHYKFLGSDFVKSRYNQYINRVSEASKSEGLASQYEESIQGDNIDNQIEDILKNSVEINI